MKRKVAGSLKRCPVGAAEVKRVAFGNQKAIIRPARFDDADNARRSYYSRGAPLGSAWLEGRIDKIALTEEFYVDEDGVARYEDGILIPGFGKWPYKRQRISPVYMQAIHSRCIAYIKDVEIVSMLDIGQLSKEMGVNNLRWDGKNQYAWVYFLSQVDRGKFA